MAVAKQQVSGLLSDFFFVCFLLAQEKGTSPEMQMSAVSLSSGAAGPS